MIQETTIVKIYNEKYKKHWTCTFKSYKNTWSQNGWTLVGIDEDRVPQYKEVEKPWEKKKKKSFFRKVIDKLSFKK